MKGPGLFSEIGKKAKDLLNRDYTSDQKLTISTCSASGVGLTSAAIKKGGLYSFDVGSQYKYKNTLIDVKVDTNSNISTTLTISDVLPCTKAITSLKLPDYKSGKLEVHYFHHHASFASVVSLKQSPVVELSGTLGTHGVAFGAEASFDTASGKFVKYSLGIGLTKPDYNASVILEDKLDTLRASYVYHLDELQKSSVVAEIVRRFSSNENILTVGGQYAVDPQTSIKTKLNNSGKIAALLQHEVKPKSVLTISSEFDTKALEKTPKFGLALALKP
ncbi:mitochondrial outer membrane protein porin 5 [Canna indica]|uniref:Mitochondrial outer membrane protein porin 5 n=1 Tax=Canna indica TaxID=4628 RepID=A0AAQ3JLW4_9LILI|nr:mitochondrial outer membrane protein porin 5 [Canna indica]